MHRIITAAAAAVLAACTAAAPPAAAPAPLPYPEPDLNETRRQIEQLAAQIARLEAQNVQLNERIRRLEQPAPRPAAVRSKSKTAPVKQLPKTPAVSGSLQDAAARQLHQAQQYYRQGNWQAVAELLSHADDGGDGSETARQSMQLLMHSRQQLGNCQSVIHIGSRYAQRYAASPSAAEALYSVGECQWQIQQQDIARDTWRNLIRSYPNSLAARRAAARLK